MFEIKYPPEGNGDTFRFRDDITFREMRDLQKRAKEEDWDPMDYSVQLACKLSTDDPPLTQTIIGDLSRGCVLYLMQEIHEHLKQRDFHRRSGEQNG